MNECQRLAQFSRAVRESTIKRLRQVPKGLQNFRVQRGHMSFAEIAAHLLDCDDYLEAKISVNPLLPHCEAQEPGKDHTFADFLMLISRLESGGDDRALFIENLSNEQLMEPIHDGRFGEVNVWWLIMRGNLDHEIHHRGQLAAYLQMI
jgi:uncharacterized damage-inducible protein DinB